jgi:GTPase
MASRHAPKQSPIERRKGESALSEFADYVQKQQALRRPPGQAAPAVLEDHDELSILDELGLSDDAKTHIRLRTLLTDPADANVPALVEHIKERLVEGHGEVLFDVGLEDNGDSMGFSKESWEFALERLDAACEQLKANYKMLMTRNVGGDVEVGPRDAKETGYSGKMILRQQPESVDDVIETRIAVVGNVDAGKSTMLGVLVKGGLDDGRGKARVNLFRHKHEIESGRTSSVGMEYVTFEYEVGELLPRKQYDAVSLH